jgi:hypothetical protein
MDTSDTDTGAASGTPQERGGAADAWGAGVAALRTVLVSRRALAEATERLHFLQLAALVGEGYDPDALDRLLDEYRAAK